MFFSLFDIYKHLSKQAIFYHHDSLLIINHTDRILSLKKVKLIDQHVIYDMVQSKLKYIIPVSQRENMLLQLSSRLTRKISKETRAPGVVAEGPLGYIGQGF